MISPWHNPCKQIQRRIRLRCLCLTIHLSVSGQDLRSRPWLLTNNMPWVFPGASLPLAELTRVKQDFEFATLPS